MAFFQNFYLLTKNISKMDKFLKWINNFTSKSTFPSIIFSKFIWFNSNIRIASKPVHFFSYKNLELYCQLFNDNRNINSLKDSNMEFHLKATHKIYWLQVIVAFLKIWKGIIFKDKGNIEN